MRSFLEEYKCDGIIDANETTVTEALLSRHVHPVIGDYTPRQNMMSGIYRKVHFTVE